MAPPDHTKLHKIVETALQYGYQLSPGALTLLAAADNFDRILRDAIRNTNQVIITKEVLTSIKENMSSSTVKVSNELSMKTSHAEPTTPSLESRMSITPSSTIRIERFAETAKEINAEIEILNSFVPTKEPGGIDGFFRLFKNRFEKLRILIESRPDSRGIISLTSMSETRENESVKIVGMINEIHRARKGGIFLNLEDESGEGRCFIPVDVLKNDALLPDTMILVKGRVKDSLLIATEIAQPDIPTTFRPSQADIPLFVVLLSDLHVGSKSFLKNVFLKLLQLIQGDTSAFPEYFSRIVPLIKYIINAGDIIDGVGVYPGQERDLSISDIHTQYETVAKLLSAVPDHIEVILIPGNHDATRQALPQPPVAKKFADAFADLSNIHFLGNPSFIKLHGVRFLLNHGRPLDDAIPFVPGASFQNQKKALRQLLKARHIGPIYGAKTPYAPETNDFLVIEDIPDVWHLGHTHVNEFVVYRGVKIINTGTFQSQTDWQKSLNINPTPGIVPFFNLQNHGVVHLSF